MALDPHPPIVIFEDGDLVIFPSSRAAGRKIEAIDVRKGIFEGFDSDGCPLDIWAHEDDSIEFSRRTGSCAPDVVRDRIVNYLGSTTLRPDMARHARQLELPDLLAFVMAELRWE